MKLQTFITNNQAKIEEFEIDYIANNVEAIKKPLQEFFGAISNIVIIYTEYDKYDILYRELDERITANQYTNAYDKERDEVDKLNAQAQKYLLNKDAERLKHELVNIIATINVAKGV